MNIINYRPIWRKLMRRTCAKCSGELIKHGLGYWFCPSCAEPGRMHGKLMVLLFAVLAGLFAGSVQAQEPNHSYLPIFRQDPPPATFDLRVMRVSAGNSIQAGCVNPLAPVLAAQGAICPLPGDYISLVADNPDSIALGGRQGDGSDAAWAGDTSEFSLIAPTQVIVDAARVDIDVPGYVESAGLFTASDSDYAVIKINYSVAAVGVAQTEPSLSEQSDFHQTLEQMLDENQIFDVDFAGDMQFWDRYGLVRLRLSACGVSHGVWLPDVGKTSFLAMDRFPPWILQGGHFEPAGLDTCMGDYRWVKMGELMTVPEAANLQSRVNQRRGGAATPFQWVTDQASTIYAVITVATGTVAYYFVQAVNSATPNPAMFLFVPTDMLNCVTVAGIKTCTVTEGEPSR